MKSFLLTTFSLAGLVLAAGAARADDVRVIVGFKGEPSTGLVSQHGGRIHRASGNFVAASLPAKALAKLRAEAAVAYVEEDAVAEALGKVDAEAKGKPGTTTTPPQDTPWGVEKVNAPSAWSDRIRGSGVGVAVIDTGIDLDHPDLKDNVAADGWDFANGDSIPDDDNGHGSHVSGTIASVDNLSLNGGKGIGYIGVAPEATLYAVKVLDRRGSGWLSDVADGIYWVADAFPTVSIANMSLGSSSDSPTLRAACAAAADAGVLLVAAAGNSGDGSTSTTEMGYPAAYESCVAVGATTSNDGLATFSNTGSYLEISAPGVSIPSTYKNAGYALLSGTSMASPHGAGMAALIWESISSPSAAAVRAELQTKVVDVGGDNWDAGFGFGRIYWLEP